LITVASSSDFQSAVVVGLFGLCTNWACQSLGVAQGNSQQKRLMT
jgi:hypothetical protein